MIHAVAAQAVVLSTMMASVGADSVGMVRRCATLWQKKLTMMESKMFEIWDGDLFLYTVDTEYEADEQAEAGFEIRQVCK